MSDPAILPRVFSASELDDLESLDVDNLSSLQKELIKVVRDACQTELVGLGEFPEVSGDRRILRFLRGHKVIQIKYFSLVIISSCKLIY